MLHMLVQWTPDVKKNINPTSPGSKQSCVSVQQNQDIDIPM